MLFSVIDASPERKHKKMLRQGGKVWAGPWQMQEFGCTCSELEKEGFLLPAQATPSRCPLGLSPAWLSLLQAYSLLHSLIQQVLLMPGPVSEPDMGACLPALLKLTFLQERQDIHQTCTQILNHCKMRSVLSRGRTEKAATGCLWLGAWFQKEEEGLGWGLGGEAFWPLCSPAINLDYKLPHRSENPSRGEVSDHRLGSSQSLRAPGWVGICICWTNRGVNQQAILWYFLY